MVGDSILGTKKMVKVLGRLINKTPVKNNIFGKRDVSARIGLCVNCV